MKYRGILIALAFLVSAPAVAQVQYGPWRKTNDCRDACMPVGPGRCAITQNEAFGSTAKECRWEREVRDCPRIRDKLRHPIRCTTRRQRSGYSMGAPLS